MRKFGILSLMAASAIMFSGCGGDDNTTYERSTEPALEELPTSGGDSFVITNTGDNASAGMSYTKLEDGSILIDCTGGTCGDVYVASPVDNGDHSDHDGDCADGNCSL